MTDILGRLVFGTKADAFEHALDELSQALGFAGERPDKEWKEGRDNIWALDASHYLLWECKSEVDLDRAEINKRETEQMNRSSAWFDKYYPNMNVRRLMIHPSYVVQSAAGTTHEFEAVRVAELSKLTKAVERFFKSFESLEFDDLSGTRIQELINANELDITDLYSKYSHGLRHSKRAGS